MFHPHLTFMVDQTSNDYQITHSSKSALRITRRAIFQLPIHISCKAAAQMWWWRNLAHRKYGNLIPFARSLWLNNYYSMEWWKKFHSTPAWSILMSVLNSCRHCSRAVCMESHLYGEKQDKDWFCPICILFYSLMSHDNLTTTKRALPLHVLLLPEVKCCFLITQRKMEKRDCFSPCKALWPMTLSHSNGPHLKA